MDLSPLQSSFLHNIDNGLIYTDSKEAANSELKSNQGHQWAWLKAYLSIKLT